MYRFGERLKAVRKELNIQQKELARRLDIGYVTVSQWESGKRIPKGRTARKIAEALEIPVSELLNYYPCVAPVLNCYEDAIAEMKNAIHRYEQADVSEAPETKSYTDEIAAAEACKELLEDTVNTLVTQAIVNPTDDDVRTVAPDINEGNGTNGENARYEDILRNITKKMLQDIRGEEVQGKPYQLLESVSPHILTAVYNIVSHAIQCENARRAEDENDMLTLYRRLNPAGKQMLRQRLDELTEMPRYTCPIEGDEE